MNWPSRTRAPRTLAVLVASALAAPSCLAGPTLKEGELFPELWLPSLDRPEPHAVSTYWGEKTLVLVFASW